MRIYKQGTKENKYIFMSTERGDSEILEQFFQSLAGFNLVGKGKDECLGYSAKITVTGIARTNKGRALEISLERPEKI